MAESLKSLKILEKDFSREFRGSNRQRRVLAESSNPSLYSTEIPRMMRGILYYSRIQGCTYFPSQDLRTGENTGIILAKDSQGFQGFGETLYIRFSGGDDG